MYRQDPKRRKRKYIHDALNNGHRFALIDPNTGKIVEASREKRMLEYKHRLRPYLEWMDLNAELAKLMAEG